MRMPSAEQPPCLSSLWPHCGRGRAGSQRPLCVEPGRQLQDHAQPALAHTAVCSTHTGSGAQFCNRQASRQGQQQGCAYATRTSSSTAHLRLGPGTEEVFPPISLRISRTGPRTTPAAEAGEHLWLQLGLQLFVILALTQRHQRVARRQGRGDGCTSGALQGAYIGQRLGNRVRQVINEGGIGVQRRHAPPVLNAALLCQLPACKMAPRQGRRAHEGEWLGKQVAA